MNSQPTRFTEVRAMTIVAVLLSMFAATARSDDNAPGMKVAPSVAEMLQRRQESQLRERLVKEGRWDEVRKVDEEQARRQHEKQQKAVAQMNEELSRSAKSDSPATTAIVDVCDKETLRLRQFNSAGAEKNASNGPTN